MITLDAPDSREGHLIDLAPDLTPMLDVIFILLIFFMLTIGTTLQSFDLTLPSSVSENLSPVDKPDHIMLEIRLEGFAVNGEKITDFEKLKSSLPEIIKENETADLIIASDKDVPVERLLKLLTHLQSQGIEAANILMKSENQK